jgi:hypothetical protein
MDELTSFFSNLTQPATAPSTPSRPASDAARQLTPSASAGTPTPDVSPQELITVVHKLQKQLRASASRITELQDALEKSNAPKAASEEAWKQYIRGASEASSPCFIYHCVFEFNSHI